MRKASQAHRETPSGQPEQDKQEALEKLGLSPPSFQRLYSLISHLCFPDVPPHGRRGRRLSSCPDFLIKLPPELLLRSRGGGSLNRGTTGGPSPLVVWLYERLNVGDSVCYSVKRDGPLCRVRANSVGPGGGSSTCSSSAGGAECSTVTTGWHLHDLGPSARRGSAGRHSSTPLLTQAHVFTRRSPQSLGQRSLTFTDSTTRDTGDTPLSTSAKQPGGRMREWL